MLKNLFHKKKPEKFCSKYKIKVYKSIKQRNKSSY